MNKELQVFENPEFGAVRTKTIDGNPYFCLSDVCKILDIKNVGNCKTRLNNKGIRNTDTLTTKGIQSMTFINEPNLYKCIFQSRKSEAEKFQDWVTSDVLPAIRKHGVYATDELIANPDLAIAAFKALKEEREKNKKLNDTVALQQQQINELVPKASYYDVVLNCKDLVAISTMAKDYGWSAKKLNDYLHEKGIQYKQGNLWLLYQKYSEKGYTNTKTHTYLTDNEQHIKVHTYWTQKGRLFIYELLKQDNILPLIEREEQNK